MTLFGHDGQIAEFRRAMDSGKLHHAWLLSGPRGIGKRSFADMAALRLLAEAAGPAPATGDLNVEPDHPTAKLIAAHSHPDFRVLTRPPKDKTERRKPLDERNPDAELARNIPIELVRSLDALFGNTPSLSDRRAVIIDAIDDLERSGANALLKNLEEPPPKSVFLLICHNPGRILPTIRSRCRMLKFAPLDDDAMTSALKAAEPELSDSEIAALIAAGQGAPGQALAYAGLDVAGLDAAISALIGEGDPSNARRSELAQSLALKKEAKRYEVFLRRAPQAIADHAKRLHGRPMADAIAKWEEARSLASGALPLSLDPQSTVFTLAGMLASLHEPRHG